MKFRNNSLDEFERSHSLVTELLEQASSLQTEVHSQHVPKDVMTS